MIYDDRPASSLAIAIAYSYVENARRVTKEGLLKHPQCNYKERIVKAP
jgi:hypothetical protein